MTRRWTIRTRLIMTLALVVTAVIITVATITTLAVRDYLEDRVGSRLASASERIRATLLGFHGLTIDFATMSAMARAESTAVVVDTPTEPLWTNTDADTARLLLETELDDGRPEPIPGRQGLVAVRMDTAGMGLVVRDQGRTVTANGLIIAIDASNDFATFSTMVLASTAGTCLSIALLVGLTVIIVRRGLRPLRSMADDARAFAEGDRSRRLLVDHDDPDIARLASAVNEAFDAQQEAEDRLRAFVADASHELRTPLTTATGWIELYLQGGLDDPGQRDRAMQRVATQLGRMRVLVDELALLARLDRARPLDAEPVDLTALTAEVVDDARVMNPDRAFTFSSAGPAAVLGDAPKLQQVLLNVLDNAVQHTPAGSPVEVAVVPADAGSSGPARHTLTVTDHGPGIPAHEQPHVFERFWRSDASRDRHTGGSGLGLSIVASIVAAHHGSSEVTSRVGHGTTVRITFPAVPAGPVTPALRTTLIDTGSGTNRR